MATFFDFYSYCLNWVSMVFWSASLFPILGFLMPLLVIMLTVNPSFGDVMKETTFSNFENYMSQRLWIQAKTAVWPYALVYDLIDTSGLTNDMPLTFLLTWLLLPANAAQGIVFILLIPVTILVEILVIATL